MAASNSPSTTEPILNDLGPLAWVLGEVRTSLEASSKALKRFVRDAAQSRGKDMASIDSSQLRLAKQQLRQVVGALEMVDLEKPAQLLRAMESAVERFIQNPELCSDAAADQIENAGFALTAYLENMLAGRKTSAVALFPQYEEIQKLAASARIHPADLWETKWRWSSITSPAAHTQLLELDTRIRSQMDAPLLQVMRSFDSQAARVLEATAAGISLSSNISTQQQTLWRLAAGFFAAVSHKLLPADLYVKRAATGVLLQASDQIKDSQSLNARLAQDLLFFNAHIQNRDDIPAAVAAVLAAYNLHGVKGLDYHKRSFGHYDPALLVQARKRIAAVKETWSLVTAGESNKYQLIKDQIQAIADSIAKLFPAGQDLAQALLAVADHILRIGRPPETHVAMEVATSLLYAEAVLEDADLGNPELEARTQRLAERIANAQQGGTASPLDSWMEELYRQVSDRQNMGSVVGELKISLGELEKLMDQFFRNTEDLSPLTQIPGKLAQMRGVMSILGLDDAIKAVQWMREHIEHMAIGQLSVAQAQDSGIFDKVGTNLGALGFLIDMLSYQPVLAKKLFIYDNDRKELKPLMGRAQKQDTPSAVAPTASLQSPSPLHADSAPALELSVSTGPLTQVSTTLFDATTKLHLDEVAPHAPAQQPVHTPDTEGLDLAIDLDFAGIHQSPPAEIAALDTDADLSPTPHITELSINADASHPALAPVPAPQNTPSSGENTELDDLDDELLEIFLEEASEVVTQGLDAIAQLRANPQDHANLTTLRRSFHTLKGSSRMVGLNNFGESAWSMEQVLNTWLADSKPANEPMLDLSQQSMEIFGSWTELLRNSRSDGAYHPAPFQASSEAMRVEQHYLPLIFAQQASAEGNITSEIQPAVQPEVSADIPIETPSSSAEIIEQADATPTPTKLPSLDEILSQQTLAGISEITLTLPADTSLEALPSAAEATPPTLGAIEQPSTEADFDLLDLNGSTHDIATPVEPASEQPLSDSEFAVFNTQPSDSGATESALTVEPLPSDLSTSSLASDAPENEEDGYKVIGDLRISIPLYNAFLGEADDWSRRLVSEMTEWALTPELELGNSTVALAHSLAGTSGTVGHTTLSEFARTLEHCLARDQHLETSALAHRYASIYASSAEEIRHLLHQFAAGILLPPSPSIHDQLQQALNDEAISDAVPLGTRIPTEDLLPVADEQEDPHIAIVEHAAAWDMAASAPSPATAPSLHDHPADIDQGLFPIFEEEAQELLPELGNSLRQWHKQPDNDTARSAVLRVLHTLKGSARLTGAMHLGAMVHNLESHIEILGQDQVPSQEIEQLIHRSDDINDAYEALRLAIKAPMNAAPLEEFAAAWGGQEAATLTVTEDADTSIPSLDDPSGASFPTDHSLQPNADTAPLVLTVHQAPPPVEESSPVAEINSPVLTPVPLESPPVILTPPLARSIQSEIPHYSAHFDGQIDAVDSIDENLFPIFEDEANELLPELGNSLRQWHAQPADTTARSNVLRVLHTLKGSARLAGAMRLGEMAHHLESGIEMLGAENVPAHEIDNLLASNDDIHEAFQILRQQLVQGNGVDAPTSVLETHLNTSSSAIPTEADQAQAQKLIDQHLAELSDTAAVTSLGEGISTDLMNEQALESPEPSANIAEDDSESPALSLPTLPARASYVVRSNDANTQTVRVRSHLLDLLVNLAGEVMITRAKLENEIGAQLRSAVNDLTGNLGRLRQQLRDIEVQAESQMQSRLALSKETSQTFDPLEFDRFTRVQELTRMMAESVNDVATVQRNMQAVADATEGALVAQARQTRELQRYLLRTRMVEFDSVSDRLYRVIRQAGKDTSKQVRLDIVGASIELDRGVLERMTPAFEHLLRNCVAHGIEAPEKRHAAGKEASGLVTIQVRQAGNDIAIEFKDDGAGLNVSKILEKAKEKGLIDDASVLSDAEVFNLIYHPGFSTATEVSAISGRGVGMDIVKSEVQALGGRIETHSIPDQGSSFKLVLPLTTAVTQVVMVRAGHVTFGIPANLLEIVRRATQKELEQAYADQEITFQGEQIPFHWVGALLQSSPASSEPIGRSTPIVIIRSAAQRIAIHVDEVLGNQEVVVKNLGPQLSRLPGLAGMSLLPSGAVVLIYNPVALHTVYRLRVAEFVQHAKTHELSAQASHEAQTPLIMVVDDSITVRRVTQRLLQREGYRVLLANDGLMALEKLGVGEELPSVILSDIEMPRMDGFDLLRNIRADERLTTLPVAMITSRMAEKHREHAMSLGANHYLGKPYGEEELLGIIRSYTDLAPVSSAA